MKKLKGLLLASIVALLTTVTASAQETTVWEIAWNFFNFRHQGLMVLTGNNNGILHVRVFDRTTGELVQGVYENVQAQNTYDGSLLQCYNPRVVRGDGHYTADNFKFFENGTMMMMDDAGNWSYEVRLRQIINREEMDELTEQYGL